MILMRPSAFVSQILNKARVTVGGAGTGTIKYMRGDSIKISAITATSKDVFVTTPWTGTTVSARLVTDITPATVYAMLRFANATKNVYSGRYNTNAGAKYSDCFSLGSDKYQYRGAAADTAIFRVVKLGNDYKGYVSTDGGSSFTQIGTTTTDATVGTLTKAGPYLYRHTGASGSVTIDRMGP